MIPRDILSKACKFVPGTGRLACRAFSRLWLIVGAMVLCSCATKPQPSATVPASDLPAEVTLNREAGRGGVVMVTLRLGTGEALPFVMDICFEEHSADDGRAVTYTLWEKDTTARYHYEVLRTSNVAPWQLQRAWRTDPQDRVLEEYVVP